MATVMARAYKNALLMNLLFFGDVLYIASFCTFSDELASGWRCQDGNDMFATYFACKLFLFSRFDCANLLKLGSAC
jgi:hypothetical protein